MGAKVFCILPHSSWKRKYHFLSFILLHFENACIEIEEKVTNLSGLSLQMDRMPQTHLMVLTSICLAFLHISICDVSRGSQKLTEPSRQPTWQVGGVLQCRVFALLFRLCARRARPNGEVGDTMADRQRDGR